MSESGLYRSIVINKAVNPLRDTASLRNGIKIHSPSQPCLRNQPVDDFLFRSFAFGLVFKVFCF